MLQNEAHHLGAVLGDSLSAHLLEQICCRLDFVEVVIAPAPCATARDVGTALDVSRD
jgi:hypothetical protein